MVFAEHVRDLAESLDRQVTGDPRHECRLQCRVVEQPVDERRPALVEVDAGLDVIEDPETRGQADLEGMLAQETLREPVQRAECRVVELGQGPGAAVPGGLVAEPVVVAGRDSLERGADPVAELRGGGLRERDRGEVAQVDVPGCHQAHDPVHERGGLAGPGARLDEETDVVHVAHRVACRLVVEGGHGTSPAGSRVSAR